MVSESHQSAACLIKHYIRGVDSMLLYGRITITNQQVPTPRVSLGFAVHGKYVLEKIILSLVRMVI